MIVDGIFVYYSYINFTKYIYLVKLIWICIFFSFTLYPAHSSVSRGTVCWVVGLKATFCQLPERGNQNKLWLMYYSQLVNVICYCKWHSMHYISIKIIWIFVKRFWFYLFSKEGISMCRTLYNIIYVSLLKKKLNVEGTYAS